MTEPRYFLGLDGGATKTHAVLYDRAGDRLAFNTGGPTNHEVLPGGMDGLPEAITAVVQPLFDRFGISFSRLDCASFGMGGEDTAIQHEMISKILRTMGFQRFVLSNDAFLGVKAVCDGPGISAVNGTGYSVAGIGPDGQMLQIGGHGEMTGDKGGGNYLVPAAVRAAYAELYKDGPKTRLTALIGEWLDTQEPEAFCQAVGIRVLSDGTAAYNVLSKILYRASAEGDGEARRILTECGQDYAVSVRCAAERLGLKKPVDVALVGSQFTRCEDPQAIRAMRAGLDPDGTGRAYRLHVIETEPVAGALFWALETGGFKPDRAARQTLGRRINEEKGKIDG